MNSSKVNLEKINYNHLSPTLRTLRKADLEKQTGVKNLFNPMDFFGKSIQVVKHNYTAKIDNITQKQLKYEYFLTPGENVYFDNCFYLDVHFINLQKTVTTIFTFKDGIYTEVCRHEAAPFESISEAIDNKVQKFLKENK